MTLLARQRPTDVLDAMVHYPVDTPDGAVGILDAWERDEQGQPTTLIVAQGWFGRRRFAVPVEKLVEVDYGRGRLVLARGAAPLEPKGPLQRLMGFGQSRSAGEAPNRTGWPVLCGVADDRHARTVVAVAARLAKKLEAPLVLTHVTPRVVPPGVSAAPDGQARLREEEQREADKLIDALLSDLAPSATEVRRIVRSGTPAQTLEELAGKEGAQLIVIGSGRRGHLGALLKGSVSHHMVSHASCPVVVVPPDLTSFPRDDDEHDEGH